MKQIVWWALLAVCSVVHSPNQAIAQSTDPCAIPGTDRIRTDCGRNVRPPRGSRGGTQTSADPEMVFDALAVQFRNAPTSLGKRDDSAVFYNLKIEKLCGKGSVSEAAERFIREAPSGWWKEKRAVALTLTLSFAEAAEPKTATIPIIALATDGDGKAPNVIKCTDVVLPGIPLNQALTVQFDLNYASGEFVLGDQPKAIAEAVGHALGAAALFGPHTATAGATIIAFAGGLDGLTKAANDFLKIFKNKSNEIPHIHSWEETSSRLAYGKESAPLLGLRKEYRITNVHYAPGNINALAGEYNTRFGAANNLGEIEKLVGVKLGVAQTQNTPENVRALCGELAGQSAQKYGTDGGAVALSILYYMTKKAEVFKPTQITCLAEDQIKLVNSLGFTSAPYPGAFDVDAAGKLAEKKAKEAEDKKTKEAEEKKKEEEKKNESPAAQDAVSDTVFNQTKDLMLAFTRQIKNLPARIKDGSKAAALKDLQSLFDESVMVAGEGVGLLPRVDGLPADELAVKISEWGLVTRFGCYGKPKSSGYIKRGVTGEALILFPDRSLLAHARFGKMPDNPKKLVLLELSKASEEVVERLMNRETLCGLADEGWDPRIDYKRLNAVSQLKLE